MAPATWDGRVARTRRINRPRLTALEKNRGEDRTAFELFPKLTPCANLSRACGRREATEAARERTRFDLVLPRGRAVRAQLLLRCSPHLRQECHNRVGIPSPRIFDEVQQIATVCEQSATVFTREMSVQQFVNRVQQIATSAAAKIALKQPKPR